MPEGLLDNEPYAGAHGAVEEFQWSLSKKWAEGEQREEKMASQSLVSDGVSSFQRFEFHLQLWAGDMGER